MNDLAAVSCMSSSARADSSRGGTMRKWRLMRRVRKAERRLREVRMLIRAFRFPYQPVNAHLIPIRRCNLSCAYCNEYDDHSTASPDA